MNRLVTEAADGVRLPPLGRIPGGFGTRGVESSVSPLSLIEDVWLLGTDMNAWIAPSLQTEAGPPFAAVVAGSAADPLLILSYAKGAVGSATELVAQAFLASGEPASEPEEVLDILHRPAASNAVALSADGERVAIGNGQSGARVPRFALLDKRAHKVGEAQLYEPGESVLFHCFTLTGTEHGVLGSVVDELTDELHVVELDANGEARTVITWPMSRDFSCPVVSSDPTGIYFAFPDRGTEPSARGSTVFRVTPGGLSQVTRLPPTRRDVSRAWVAGGALPLIEIRSASGTTFARWKDDTPLPLTGGPFPGARVPSSDGRIYLEQREAGQRRISEIVCGGGEP
ncbi:hypothetical protein [Sorangium sp. So ce1024]|uniref:hypothetical protein n=1 Tax=Sorangium sp. So ce1024 TaxID=3133327 RepID=UPI003F0E3D9B